ncbi:MAG: hypothetical protein AAF349_26380, partial [Cyanobacteria bacterium P01_A01_bin.68]
LATISFLTLIIIGLPLLIIGLIFRTFLPQPWRKYSNLIVLSLLVSLSIYTVNALISETRYAVDIPGYRVEFYEPADVFFFDVPRYFVIHQEDGKKADFQIDIDAFRCLGLQTKTQRSRVYFQCPGESPETASYVDKEKLTVFSGWYQKETPISKLKFINPDKT